MLAQIKPDPSADTPPSVTRPLDNVSYTDLPLELREQILSYCTAKTLAHLSVTSKGVAGEAERMLYETVSLHLSRQSQMAACLRTLSGPLGKEKALLVQTFSATFNHPEEDAKLTEKTLAQLQVALRLMTSLKVLSVWAPERCNIVHMGVRQILEGNVFVLRRLYISGLRDIPRLLSCQPYLEVVGLWSTDTPACSPTSPEILRWQLAEHLFSNQAHADLPEEQPTHPPQGPVVFGMDLYPNYPGGLTLRSLTIYDYSLGPDLTAPTSNAGGERLKGRETPSMDFLEFPGDNVEIQAQLLEDLRLDFSQDRRWRMTNCLRLTLRDVSLSSLLWAQKISRAILERFPPREDFYNIPYIQLPVINAPKPDTLDMRTIREPFKQLSKIFLDHTVDDFAFMNYSDDDIPKVGRDAMGDEAEEMAGPFVEVVHEVVRERPGGLESRLDFAFFEVDFVLP